MPNGGEIYPRHVPAGLLELSHLQATSSGVHLALYHWLLSLVSLGLSRAHSRPVTLASFSLEHTTERVPLTQGLLTFPLLHRQLQLEQPQPYAHDALFYPQ